MINIQIDEELVYIDVEKDGRNFKKATNLRTFRETVGITERSYDSGLLPGQTGTKRIIDNNRHQKVIYIHPAHKRTVRFTGDGYPGYSDDHGYTQHEFDLAGYTQRSDESDDDYEERLRENFDYIVNNLIRQEIYPKTQLIDIMVPEATIIASKANDASRWRIRIFTLGFNTMLTGRERLYEFPAPNIYGGAGEICWGDDEFDTDFDKLQVLQSIVPSFLSSPFNYDLSSGRLQSGSIIDMWHRMDQKFAEGASEEEVLEMYYGNLRETGRTIDSYI